jgi:hypothetical protein
VRDITPTCASAGKPCYPANQTTSNTGFEEHTYTYIYDFTTAIKNGCCTVIIGTGQCCRNGSITTGGLGSNFWVWSMINLCLTPQNSSPVFYSPPKQILGCNQPVYYNIAARDTANYDSLVYELVDPMQDWSSKTSWNSGFSSQNPYTVYCPKWLHSCLPKSIATQRILSG